LLLLRQYVSYQWPTIIVTETLIGTTAGGVPLAPVKLKLQIPAAIGETENCVAALLETAYDTTPEHPLTVKGPPYAL
jgi:hypothetical protein